MIGEKDAPLALIRGSSKRPGLEKKKTEEVGENG